MDELLKYIPYEVLFSTPKRVFHSRVEYAQDFLIACDEDKGIGVSDFSPASDWDRVITARARQTNHLLIIIRTDGNWWMMTAFSDGHFYPLNMTSDEVFGLVE